MLRVFLSSLLVILTLSQAGCAYTLRTSRNPYLDEKGIKTLYIEPVKNKTFRPGVENLIYNALKKTFSAQRQVRLVTDKSQADAELRATVSDATYARAASTRANSLSADDGYFNDPLVQGADAGNIIIASVYRARLLCEFTLIHRKTEPRRESTEELWNAYVARTKNFSSNTQLGVRGTTSALINDSEFDRALADLAEGVASDAHEEMFSFF